MVVTTKPSEDQLAPADAFMLRLLRLPTSQEGTSQDAQSSFQKSILISALRCLITYIFLPFIAPTIGFVSGIGPVVGVIVALAAMVSITFSMRRFFSSRHPHRWTYTALGGTMFVFLVYLLARDLIELL